MLCGEAKMKRMRVHSEGVLASQGTYLVPPRISTVESLDFSNDAAVALLKRANGEMPPAPAPAPALAPDPEPAGAGMAPSRLT